MVLTDQHANTMQVPRADAHLPTGHGNFRVRAFPELTDEDHCVIYTGQPWLVDAPLVRIHSECLTGDALSSLKCDCGPQLKSALDEIQENGTGMVIYLRQEGRGIGLTAKIQAYALQDRGYDTLDANLLLGHPADARDYSIAAKMLQEMGVTKVRLMTNNPLKFQGLVENGIEVLQRIEHIDGVGPYNREYLSTKAARMGHLIEF